MGNPPIDNAATPPPAADAGNGILARVAGDHIARGMQMLSTPDAGLPQADRDVVLEVPDLGAVKVTYRLKSHKRGRSRRWFWVAVRADRI